MLHLYQYAAYYYKKAAGLRPDDARMWSAVGNCLLKLGLRGEAIAVLERAVACGDSEGISTRELAKLCRWGAIPRGFVDSESCDAFYRVLACLLGPKARGRAQQSSITNTYKPHRCWTLITTALPPVVVGWKAPQRRV